MVACVFIYFTLETPVSRSRCFSCFLLLNLVSNFFPSLSSLWDCSDSFLLAEDTCAIIRGCSWGSGAADWLWIWLYYWTIGEVKPAGMFLLTWWAMVLAVLTMTYARFVTPATAAFLTWWSLFQRSFLTLFISLQRYILFVSISAIFFWYAACSSLSPSTFWVRFASSGPLIITEATSCGVLTSLTFFLNLYAIISEIDMLSISDDA